MTDNRPFQPLHIHALVITLSPNQYFFLFGIHLFYDLFSIDFFNMQTSFRKDSSNCTP